MTKKSKMLIVEDEYIIADVLGDILQRNDFEVCGIAGTVKEALQMVELHQPCLVLLDIYLKGELTGIDMAKSLSEADIPFIYISANSNRDMLEAAKQTNPYGFVVKPFREKDVLVAIEIALYRHENNLESALRQHGQLQKTIAQAIATEQSWTLKLLQVVRALQPIIPFEYLSVEPLGTGSNKFEEIGFLRIGFNEYQVIEPEDLAVVTKHKFAELCQLKSKSAPDKMDCWYNSTELPGLFKSAPLKELTAKTYKLKSLLTIQVPTGNQVSICLNFYSRRTDAYQADHLILGERFKPILTGFAQRMNDDPGNPFNPASAEPKHYKDEVPAPFTPNFEGIIGSSHLLLNVFDHIQQVAPFNTSVLILGESGTGKEKIADRIHYLSSRKNQPFVKVNCAALPATLIDSELFGHEKGAFTGAIERKTGRFEMAHKGTIFLDEIGELPLELQVKLLRVLQEKEIERIGGRTTIKTDVRVIAATNRNLEKEVAEGRFRLDLYYRLNVIQMLMPPLRERLDDIPALSAHFLKIYNRKAGKHIKGFSAAALEGMKHYHWPGNIRELENLVERSVLLNNSDVIEHLHMPFATQKASVINTLNDQLQSMSENEKTHIIAALKKCHGKVYGKGGAAELLELPPTTLNSKMKKLGIQRPSYN